MKPAIVWFRDDLRLADNRRCTPRPYPHPIVDHDKARLRALRNVKSLA